MLILLYNGRLPLTEFELVDTISYVFTTKIACIILPSIGCDRHCVLQWKQDSKVVFVHCGFAEAHEIRKDEYIVLGRETESTYILCNLNIHFTV